MVKVENVDVWGLEHAVRGCRNPLNSWGKSDSTIDMIHGYKVDFHLGENDLDLMKRLYKAGTEHRKYLRQIFVSMDIVAPLFWWRQFDTYKIGTVANSCSTMHRIHAKEFTIYDFSHERLDSDYSAPFCPSLVLARTIDALNFWRGRYLATKNKSDWLQMTLLLPTSYNQRRTVTMNYENVVTIIKQRTGHKLDEWNEFIKVLRELPYINEIMGE